MFSFFNKFKNQSDEELLKNSRSENYAQIKSKSEKINLLQEVENRNAEAQGRPPCKVVPLDKKYELGCFGEYSEDKNTISVNMRDDINPYEMLDTIYHEGEHAFQTHCVECRRAGKPMPEGALPKETLDMCEVESFYTTKDNLHLGSGDMYLDKSAPLIGQYYNYKATVDYRMCTSEIDSNTYAANKVMQNRELWKGDSAYVNYLESRIDECSAFDKKINNGTMRYTQENAVNESYARGDLSNQRRWDMIDNTVYTKGDQPAVKSFKETQTAIQDEYYRAKHQVEAEKAAAMSEKFAIGNKSMAANTSKPVGIADELTERTIARGAVEAPESKGKVVTAEDELASRDLRSGEDNSAYDFEAAESELSRFAPADGKSESYENKESTLASFDARGREDGEGTDSTSGHGEENGVGNASSDGEHNVSDNGEGSTSNGTSNGNTPW